MSGGAHRTGWPHMTKDKFQTLCEDVLVPLLGKILHHQLAELHDTLEVMAREMVRMGDQIGDIAASITTHDDDATSR
jgi:hypothetical protein